MERCSGHGAAHEGRLPIAKIIRPTTAEDVPGRREADLGLFQ
jgi:hypothetical protein